MYFRPILLFQTAYKAAEDFTKEHKSTWKEPPLSLFTFYNTTKSSMHTSSCQARSGAVSLRTLCASSTVSRLIVACGRRKGRRKIQRLRARHLKQSKFEKRLDNHLHEHC